MFRYHSSPSARRRRVKDNDCKFCDENIIVEDLLGHLNSRERCRLLYFKSLSVKTMSEFSVKFFSCENCLEIKPLKLSIHMQKNFPCFQFYRRKYECSEIQDILMKIRRLKRRSIPSRQPLSRKKERDVNITEVCSLNNFRRRVSFSNYNLCVHCKAHFLSSNVKEVKPDDDYFDMKNLSSAENMSMRRFEKYFICSRCAAEESENPEHLQYVPSLDFQQRVSDDSIFFYPTLNSAYNFVDETVISNCVSIMMPKSFGIAKNISKQDITRIKSQRKYVARLNSANDLRKSDIICLYEKSLLKYHESEVYSRICHGSIQNGASKVLNNIEILNFAQNLSGSPDWTKKQLYDLQWRQRQFGTLFITFTAELPIVTRESVATALLQMGYVVTTREKELATGEIIVEYMVHLEHLNNEDCSGDCGTIVDLDSFLELTGLFDVQLLGSKFVGTTVSTAFLKMQSLMQNIVGAPSNVLFSKDFHLMLIFGNNGQGKIVGCLWPEELSLINEDFATNSRLTMASELISFVERGIFVTSDPNVLIRMLGVSEFEAQELSSLVRKHQIHICDEADCSLCPYPEWPSLETECTDITACSRNVESSKRLKGFMREQLIGLSVNQKLSLSTMNWLDFVWQRVTGEVNGNRIELELDESESVVFEIDGRLAAYLQRYRDSPLTGVYQYALTCVSTCHPLQIILKRACILEAFTRPYNPLYLKSIQAPIEMNLVNSSEMFRIELGSCLDNRHRHDDLNPTVLMTHGEQSLCEVVANYDPTVKRILTSTRVQYVNTKPNRKLLFRKTSEIKDTNFSVEGSNEQYELLDSIVSRHFMRINGQKLILAETAMWYQFIGKKMSKEVFPNRNLNVQVPLSDVKCVSSDLEEDKLPQFILCRNGDVLRKRSKPLILSFPKTKSCYEEMYCKLLAFYPLNSEDDLDDGIIDDKYSLMHQSGTDTIVRFNERSVYLEFFDNFIVLVNLGNCLNLLYWIHWMNLYLMKIWMQKKI